MLITDAAVVEFESSRLTLPESATEHPIKVIRTGDLSASLRIGVSPEDLTSAGARDYQLSTRFIDFAPGEDTQTIHFRAIQDHLTEEDEEVLLQLEPAPGDSTLSTQGTLHVTIADSDRPGSVDQEFRLDAAVGLAGDVFSPVAGAEWITVQPDGKLLVSGAFSFPPHVTRIGLIRLLPDGSMDTNFTPLPRPDIFDEASHSFTCLLPHGDILVATGVPSTEEQLIRLHVDGTRDEQFHVKILPLAPFPLLHTALVQADGRIVIGGLFSHVNGIPRGGLARLESDGRVDLSFMPDEGDGLPSTDLGPVAGMVNALALQKDGTIWVGGQFTRFGNQPRNHLARLDSQGKVLPDNTARLRFAQIGAALPVVNSVLCDEQDRVLVSGQFDQVDGISKTNMVRLTPNGRVDVSFDAPSAAGCQDSLPFGAVRSVTAERGGRLLVNLVASRGRACRTFFRVLQDGALDEDFTDPPRAAKTPPAVPYIDIRCVAMDASGSIFIGGPFTQLEVVSQAAIARLNGGVRHFRFGGITHPSDGSTKLAYEIPQGHAFRLLSSSDLQVWEAVPDSTPLLNRNQFAVPASPEKTRRFYKAERLAFPE